MTTAEMATEKAKKKFKFPTAFTTLGIITFIICGCRGIVSTARNS